MKMEKGGNDLIQPELLNLKKFRVSKHTFWNFNYLKKSKIVVEENQKSSTGGGQGIGNRWCQTTARKTGGGGSQTEEPKNIF